MLLMTDVKGECRHWKRRHPRFEFAAADVHHTRESGAQAMLEIRARTFIPPVINAKRPHWVEYIRLLLEAHAVTKFIAPVSRSHNVESGIARFC